MREGFETMVEFTAPVFWLFFLLTGVSLLVLRRREPEVARPFTVPLYPITPLVFCATCAYLLYASLAYSGAGLDRRGGGGGGRRARPRADGTSRRHPAGPHRRQLTMRILRFPVPFLALILAAVVAASAQTPVMPKEPDVPYVPTHEKVVAEMLKVANVKKSDVLYDLGSGDGRIVITAAKKFGTRGTGIELLPALVREARENAEKAGVSQLAKFIEGDIFEANISDATVVTLYLLPAVNMKLRPKLLALRPGTRIVSHNYDMEDWKPLKTIKLNLSDGEHTVFFWVVPPPKKS